MALAPLAVPPANAIKSKLDLIQTRLENVVLGSQEASSLLIISLLAGGHALIQGEPGIGKTSLAKAIAHLIHGRFRRVQFTPDLLPSDILGYSVYHQASGRFEFMEGPVFSHLLLADEINRTSPRVQSALLECMNEGQVSLDGETRYLATPFMVVATQNSLYSTGTFALPEPQLDRFLISIEMQMPPPAMQSRILQQHLQGNHQVHTLEPLATVEEVRGWQQAARDIAVAETICHYIVALCEAVRHHRKLRQGVSTRGSLSLLRAAQASALLQGQSAVFPDDVKRVFIPVLAHRLALADEEQGSWSGEEPGRRRQIAACLQSILSEIPVP